MRDGLGAEQARKRLRASDNGTAQDETHDDDTRQVFRTAQTIGEPRRGWTACEHKGHPERKSSCCITEVVDGVSQQGHTARHPDNHDLDESRGAQADKRPFDGP
jgi:hypothetical protein